MTVTTPSVVARRRAGPSACRYRTAVGFNPFREQVERRSDIVLVGAALVVVLALRRCGPSSADAATRPTTSGPTTPTTPRRRAPRAAVPGGEGVPLPGLRPRDPAGRGPRGRRAARATRATAATGTPAAGTATRRSAARAALRTRLRSPRRRARRRGVDAHRRDVEAQRRAPRAVLGEPARREHAEAPLLAWRHRLDRRAERVAAAGLHLAEHDDAAPRRRTRSSSPSRTAPVAVERPRSRAASYQAAASVLARRAERAARIGAATRLRGPCRRAPRCSRP